MYVSRCKDLSRQTKTNIPYQIKFYMETTQRWCAAMFFIVEKAINVSLDSHIITE